MLFRSVMYWYEATYRAEGFVQRSLDGGPITKTGITFDWNHGDVGLDRGAHTGGYITRIDGDAWLEKEPLFAAPGVEYYDDPHNFNGYLAWLPKDQLWVYSTRIIARPHISEIHAYHADPVPGDVVNRYRLCYTATMRPGCLDNPGASPDGTKVLFNSNMLGSIDAYYVVAKLPETPLDVTAGRDDGSVRIAWEPSPHHLETAGYHVYRSAESGVGYEPITAEPVAATEYVDDDAPTGAVFYAVTAVEHSGIESHLSREAALGSGPRRIYIEAEDGERSQEMWLAHQGLASGLHYVWMRAHEGEGSFSIPVDLDGPERSWSMWARVRGPEGTDFTAQLADGTVTLETLPSDAWSWAQFTGALTAGATQDDLTISSGIYGSAIDSIVLTDDPDFSPEAVDRINVPDVPQVADVLADAISPYDVQVTWTDKRDATFGHYNIYCGPSEDFAPSQATLVGSPDASGHIDWGLAPGTTAFYRVAEVDRWGNEGPASDVAEVTTPAVERVVIEEPSADEVTLSVPADGTHVLWLKLAKGGRGSNYIDVKIDGDSRTWTCGFDGLSDESWFSYGEWGLFGLAAGDHVLTLTNKSEHSVESILLTNDASYQPEGHVNILTGW